MITETIDINKSNIAIYGAGRNSNIVIGGNIAAIELAAGLSGMTFKDFAITGTGAGASQRGIIVPDANGSYFRNLYISSCGAEGIYYQGGSNPGAVIDGCYIYNCGGDGIVSYSLGLKIANCSITNCNGNGIQVFGEHHLICNCLIENIAECGININDTGAAETRDTIVTGCWIRNTGQHGILVEKSNYCILNGNFIQNADSGNTSTYDGIHIKTCDYTICNGNICILCDNYGIEIEDAASDKTVITGCATVGNGTGTINDVGTNTSASNNVS